MADKAEIEEYPRYPEMINQDVYRYKVPGGWLVGVIIRINQPGIVAGSIDEKIVTQSFFFYPDPEWKWENLADMPDDMKADDSGDGNGKIIEIKP